MENTIPRLESTRLLLRQFEMTDVSEVVRLAGDKLVADTTIAIPHPYGREDAESWIEKHQKNFEDRKFIDWAITEKTTGQLLGAIGLNLKPKDDLAEIGYWVGVPYWGKGFCTEAVKMVFDFGFSQFGLNRIYAHYMVRNPASGKVMEKAGMTFEGTLRQHVKKGNRYEDICVYGICRSDYVKQV